MKKLVLATAIAALSTSAMASGNEHYSAPEAVISLTSFAGTGVNVEASLNGTGASYQGATAHGENMSFATIGGSTTYGMDKIKLDCPEVNGTYLTETAAITASVYTGGSTQTSTFGQGAGSSTATGLQGGSAGLESEVKYKDGDLKATFEVDMLVGTGTGSTSHSVNNGSDRDWSTGAAGLETTSSVTLATLKPSYGHDSDRRGRDDHENHNIVSNPTKILITNSDTAGSLCVDSKCKDIGNVAVSLDGSNGAFGLFEGDVGGFAVGGSSVDAGYKYSIPKVSFVNGQQHDNH